MPSASRILFGDYLNVTDEGGGVIRVDGCPCDCGATECASYTDAILSEPSLIAYWPLNEASGDALDASGNGHDLLASAFGGTPVQGDPGPFPGDTAQTAYTFSNDSLRKLDAALHAIGSGVTLECWLYPTITPAIYSLPIQAGAGSGTVAYQFQFRNDHEIAWGVAAGQLFSVATLTMSTWTHVVATSSVADGMRVYFNGAQVASGAGVAPSVGSGEFRIGSHVDNSGVDHPFGGRVAQVALYGGVLSAATVINHYESGTCVPGGGSYELPATLPEIPATPTAQDVTDALVALGLVTQL